jgi:ribose 5-phosphate isomerase B
MTDEAQVREIVRQVVERTRREAGPAGSPRASRFVTADEVGAIPRGGQLMVPPGVRLTPLARDAARERGVQIVPNTIPGTKKSETATAPQPTPQRTIAIGADHGGFAMKEDLKKLLAELGYAVDDVGTHDTQAVDYPDFAQAVAERVAQGRVIRGIVVDGAGIGSCMAANKVPGVRAALCYDLSTARNAREHNDANVLTLGGQLIGPTLARDIVRAFLTTDCTAERHLRRVAKITAIEQRYLRR